MLREFRKFRGWLILEFFLTYPGSRLHLKEVARTLGISSRTAFIYLKTFKKDEILKEERVGNLTIFSLNNESPAIMALKKTHFLLVLNELGLTRVLLQKNPDIISLALYGSYADGSYDEKSTIGFLIVGHRGEVGKEPFQAVEKLTKKDVIITCMSAAEWGKMAELGDQFYSNITKNHVLLYGASLVVG